MTFQITIVYSTFYSGGDQRKLQSSASLVFVRGIHRRPVNSPYKGPGTQRMFPFDDVIMRPGLFDTKHIGSVTKWPPLYRWHCQNHFIVRKLVYFDSNFTEVSSQGSIKSITAWVCIMAWRRTGDRPLFEPNHGLALLAGISVTRPQWVNKWH